MSIYPIDTTKCRTLTEEELFELGINVDGVVIDPEDIQEIQPFEGVTRLKKVKKGGEEKKLVTYKGRLLHPYPEEKLNRKDDIKRIQATQEYMIDKILPTQNIHLLVGPSGSGKTRWLLKFMKDWIEGKEILGFKSFTKKYVYLTCDRTINALALTLKSMKMEFFPNAAYIEEVVKEYHFDPTAVDIKDVLNVFILQGVEVFFIEGLAWFMQGGNHAKDYSAQMRFWSNLVGFVLENDITIIGTMHCPKMKPSDKYENPRDRVMGSVSIPGTVGTIILLEQSEKDEKSPRRVLRVLSRDMPAIRLELIFDDNGTLVEAPELLDDNDEGERGDGKKKIVGKINFRMDEVFEEDWDCVARGYFDKFGKEHQVSRASVSRWIDDKIESGELRPTRHGFYMRNRDKNTPPKN